MKTIIASLAAAMGLIASVVWMGLAAPGSTVQAEGPALPGMCNGRSDASVVLTAHATGQPGDIPKYILNLYSDAEEKPFGTLVLGKGADRLIVENWCRLWQHIPGDPPGGGGGQCEADDHDGDDANEEGAITAHAVGIGRLRNGTQVLVRTDVRGTEEGSFFRVRYRAMGSHHEEVAIAAEDDGCEDDSWTRIPAEGWYALDQLRVKVAVPAP